MIFCSVCILTYKRFKLLKKLFDSLSSQKFVESYSIEYIVIDNDPLFSSKELINEIKKKTKLDITYLNQPIKNLSISRNLAIENANGKYIAFIDDDEYAEDDWLSNLIKCIRNYNADVVFGALDVYYEESIPEYLKRNEFFFPQNGKTGTNARYFFTGNCIIRSEILNTLEPPFDLKYGITGGEDVNMFERLLLKGAKLITCNEAKIYELVSSSRGNIKYLLKRNFRSGNGYVFRQLDLYGSGFIRRIIFLIKALVKILLSLVFLIFYIPSKVKRVKYILKISDALGKISAIFNYTIKLYK